MIIINITIVVYKYKKTGLRSGDKKYKKYVSKKKKIGKVLSSVCRVGQPFFRVFT